MTTSEHIAHDVAAGDVSDEGRQGIELADRIRMVAAQDPELAQGLVDQLIVALDQATDGTFRELLRDPGATSSTASADPPVGVQPGASSPRNS